MSDAHPDVSALRTRAEEEGQGHLFRFWEQLDDAGRARLARDVAGLDFARVRELRARLAGDAPPAAAGAFEAPEVFPLERTPAQRAQAQRAVERGAELLSAGRVGYVLVAGGQGSRLGFDGPKGKFVVGPVSQRTLFEWHAARLAAARDRYGAPVSWYVMTSSTNHADTETYFDECGWFGLGRENVLLFQQAMLPALDPDGRILLSAPDQVFLAPNGHGGTLEALRASGALEHAAARGVEHLSYFQVDNPLARPADPLFLGLHALAGAEMSSKVVTKRDAGEKVGVIGIADGKLGCIEYSDLPDALRNAKDDAGRLVFGAGNIANHVLDRAFVERLTEGRLHLPWHLARKDVQTIDDDGRAVKRAGIKFETFVFDALSEARASVTLEVDRAHEFSPVKNAEGQDSPATCRADLARLFAAWIDRAGGELPAAGDHGQPHVEVCPTFAELEEHFLERWPAAPRVVGGGHLYQP